MKNTVCKLSSRQKAAVLSVASECVKQGKDKSDAVKAIIRKLYSLNVVENSGDYNAALAVALSFYSMEKARHDEKKPIDCLATYAAFKQASEKHFSDYGAFGDFIETVLRCSCKPLNLVTFSDLHVKRQSETDIIIKGKKCEIGHNGKTFANSSEFDCIGEKVDFIVYGVFDNDEKAALYKLAIDGEFEKLFNNVRTMLYVFPVDEFAAFMTEKGFKFKGERWQVIYNDSRARKFLEKVEEEETPTVNDMF